MAYRVDICSGEWRFHFDEMSPKWKGDKKIPWQIAPIWTEEKDLSQMAPTGILDDIKRTVFIFHLRNVDQVARNLMKFTKSPEHIIFLKNLRFVNISINSSKYCIENKDNQIFLNQNLDSSWTRLNGKISISIPVQKFLKNLGPQECPKRLKELTSCELSFCYPANHKMPRINLFSVLPTTIQAGFPFLVNAPFLLNPSRETLIENDWNIFLVQEIANLNFQHVKDCISQNYSALKLLALPVIDGGVPSSIVSAFQTKMQNLLNTVPFLPPEFGKYPILLSKCSIDQMGLYKTLHETNVITDDDGPPDVVHAQIDKFEILKRYPKVKKIDYKDIISVLPNLLEEKSKLLSPEANIQVVHMLFRLYQEGKLNSEVLGSLKVMFLLTKANPPIISRCTHLFLSDCYKPNFDFEHYFADSPHLFVSEKYLTQGEEAAWKSFFTAMGVVQEAKLFFSAEIEVKEIGKIGESRIKGYLDFLWKDSESIRAKSHTNFVEGDRFNKFFWFPFLEGIKSSESYNKFFWGQVEINSRKICEEYSKIHLRYYRKTEAYKPPETYLQYVFKTQELIQDQNKRWRCAKDLYAPSIAKKSFPLDKRALLPVTLSAEMERFLGFQDIVNFNDCCRYLENLSKTFNYEFYSFLMLHLLINIKKSRNIDPNTKRLLKFHTLQGSWELINPDLKYWNVSSLEPPLDDIYWLDFGSSIPKEDRQQFCDFFGIGEESDIRNDYVQQSNPDNNLKKFIDERKYHIAFYWKEQDGDRTIDDCYKQIVLKLNTLKSHLLPEENFFEGQIFKKENNLYFASGWEDNKKPLAKVLGIYLGFTNDEIKALAADLKKKPRRYTKEVAQKFEKFKEDFDKFSSSNLKINVNDHLESPPISPRKDLSRIPPFNLDEESLETQDPQIPQIPTNTPTKPSPDQMTTPSSTIPKKSASSTSTPSSSHKKRQLKTAPAKTESEDGMREKKEIGMWAEKHVVYNIGMKYKDYQMKELPGGIREFTKGDDIIELKWNNDPKNRPPGQEDDVLWDSGEPFDIQITKKIGDLIKSKKIEVKGTKDTKIHFFLGSSEWQACLAETPKKYQIHVVTGVYTIPCITKYKDLIETIRDETFDYISKTEFTGPVVKPDVKKEE